MDLGPQVALLDNLLLSSVVTTFPASLSHEERVAVRAYLVLSHACVEEYLEDSFLKYFDKIIEIALAGGASLATVRAYLAIGICLPESRRAPYKDRTLSKMSKAAKVYYRQSYIDMNHGIKERNICKLAEGAGLDWSRFDQKLSGAMADLGTLGARRGSVGHQSPFSDKSIALTDQVYPDDARQWVEAARDAALNVRAYLDMRGVHHRRKRPRRR